MSLCKIKEKCRGSFVEKLKSNFGKKVKMLRAVFCENEKQKQIKCKE